MKEIILFLFYIVTISGCSMPKDKEVKPNILFIMTDDHSYQTFSAYDKRFIQTPNLDRIANEGVKFSNSFVTNSICAPSRAVMLTGKHSHLNGQVNNQIRFDSTQATFPKYLQEAGYQTSLIGKWHLKSEPAGFNHWDILINQGNYYNTNFIENGTLKKSTGYVTDVITDKSIDWLEKRNHEQPFCLLVHHKATHRVWMPNVELLNLYQNTEFEVPKNFFDQYENRRAAAEQKLSIREDMDVVYDLKMLDKTGEIQTKYRKSYEGNYNRMTAEQKAAWDAYYDPIIAEYKVKGLKGKELDLWMYQRYMQDYLKCVKSVDDNVGKLLNYLDDNGLAKNTMVVYTSDQGFYMGEHGWFDKRFMYEQSLRTPLVMRYPNGFKMKGEVNQMVQNIDYAPTFLDYAGLKIPKDMQGKSLKNILQNNETDWRDAIYYHYYEFPNEHMVKKHYGIRTNRYKLIHFYDDIDEWELYDLQNDPDEMNNQYGNIEFEELIGELKDKLSQLQLQYNDSVL
ncbi:MAG: arylsulfatase A-like enzyme [Saprospiraceae bacterium]|jgi:arylsulfatase A-like enzyme